jgi:hypothetical protein
LTTWAYSARISAEVHDFTGWSGECGRTWGRPLAGGALTLPVLLEDQFALVEIVLVLSPTTVLAALNTESRFERFD